MKNDTFSFLKHYQETRQEAIVARTKIYQLIGRRSGVDLCHKMTESIDNAVKTNILPSILLSKIKFVIHEDLG